MANDRFDRTARRARRAIALAGAPNQHPALAAVSPRVKGPAEAFLAAHERVRVAGSAAAKENEEALQALQPLAREYDAARAAIMANASHEQVGPAASQFATPDDLLKAAEDVEDVLHAHTGEQWAAGVLGAYAPVVEKATKEWAERVTAQSDLQKAQTARRDAAVALGGVMVHFRRAIRAVNGSTSREYHSIRGYRGKADDEQPDEGGTVPGGGSTGGGAGGTTPAGAGGGTAPGIR
ncbi:MAG: hypothetical protein HY906_08265 [Deltaproteobacteria bacterium]|nr:hypothetical protein [Deltaproteobacteria bacterium]